MTLHSPESPSTTQRELIDLLRMRDHAPKGAHSARADAQSLIESAANGGCGFGTSPTNRSQRSSIRATPKSRSPILAKLDGIVQALPVTQGMTIAPGNTLVDVADLSAVWVWAEFYQDELPLLKRDG